MRGSESPPALRVGVIGHTGRGGYGHGLDRMWARVPGTQVVAVADADPAGLAKAQQTLKLTTGYADFRRMLETVKPDIVAICPRHIEQHHAMALAAIAHGARGLYLEKPFCRTLGEADDIVAACRQHRVKCAIAHRNRYHPALNAVADLLKSGAIGALREIRASGKQDARAGAEDLWVLGSHVMNLALHFAGPATSCTAELLQQGKRAVRADVRPGAEGLGPLAGDELHARYETASGIPIRFDSAQAATGRASPAGFGLQLIATNGTVAIRSDEHPLAFLLSSVPGGEPVTITSAGAGRPEPEPDLKNLVSGHLLAGRDLVAAIRHDRRPLCNEDDGRALIEVIMAAFESHRLGGTTVKLPLPVKDNPLLRL